LENIILPDMTRGIGENISEKQNQHKKNRVPPHKPSDRPSKQDGGQTAPVFLT
jgi:hypothetical protein